MRKVLPSIREERLRDEGQEQNLSSGVLPVRRLRQTARSGRRVRLQVIFFRNPKIFHAVILADFCTKKIK